MPSPSAYSFNTAVAALIASSGSQSGSTKSARLDAVADDSGTLDLGTDVTGAVVAGALVLVDVEVVVGVNDVLVVDVDEVLVPRVLPTVVESALVVGGPAIEVLVVAEGEVAVPPAVDSGTIVGTSSSAGAIPSLAGNVSPGAAPTTDQYPRAFVAKVAGNVAGHRGPCCSTASVVAAVPVNTATDVDVAMTAARLACFNPPIFTTTALLRRCKTKLDRDSYVKAGRAELHRE